MADSARYPWHAAPAESATATPPGATNIQGRRAGVVSRVLANTLDLGAVAVVLVGGYAAVAAIRFLVRPSSFRFPAPPAILILVVGGAILFLYFLVSWNVTGRTYGDHVLGLRVISARGGPMHWAEAALRALLCVLFPIGLFWVLVSRNNRSVQDVLLRTSVVYDWSAQAVERVPTAAGPRSDVTAPRPGARP